MSNFLHPSKPGVVSIASLDTSIQVDAQYNPKELQVDKTVPWQKKSQANKTQETGIQLEFTGAEGRSLTLELLFDGYETKTSVADKVETLNTMASVLEPGSPDETKRRPHMCVVTWGTTLPTFKCVIESLSVKYTMFSDQGTPLRATCTVKLKEADTVTGQAEGGSGGGSGGSSGGTT
jgi:contractile injection system tube protein